jgi:hypothetical protein
MTIRTIRKLSFDDTRLQVALACVALSLLQSFI